MDKKIIGFDGVDGSGKTTLINHLLADADLKDRFVFTTRRKPVSPYVKEMYAQMGNFKNSYAALNLFVDDLLYRYSVMPSDKLVLSDRTFISARVFYDSISELSKISDECLRAKIEKCILNYKPILEVILLANPDVARNRIIKNRHTFTAVEVKDFQNACASRFAKFKSSESVLIVDTDWLDEDAAHTIVQEKLSTYNL